MRLPMTLDDLNQKIALRKLMETGIGLVSPKTYDEICCLIVPEQTIPMDHKPYAYISFHGIRIIQNPLIPDGEIYPFEKWDFLPKTKKEFPL